MNTPEDNINIEEHIEPKLGEDNVLYEGEYVLLVPAKQRAVVRYELAEDHETGTTLDGEQGND